MDQVSQELADFQSLNIYCLADVCIFLQVVSHGFEVSQMQFPKIWPRGPHLDSDQVYSTQPIRHPWFAASPPNRLGCCQWPGIDLPLHLEGRLEFV